MKYLIDIGIPLGYCDLDCNHNLLNDAPPYSFFLVIMGLYGWIGGFAAVEM